MILRGYSNLQKMWGLKIEGWGKGVEFRVDYYSLGDGKQYSESRRYTFSIDPNWQINDFFDHWHPGLRAYEENPTTKVACEKLTDFNLKSIADIVENRLEAQDSNIELNSHFENNDWKLVVEHKSIHHLVR